MLKVSIVIPIYNAEKYLEESIDSAINQTMSNNEYEIILVNNGSTDESPNIAEKYANSNPNISIINQENRGVCGSENTGLKNANGKYVCILHADDMIDKDMLETCYEIAEKSNLDFINFRDKAIISYSNEFESKNTKGMHDGEGVKGILSNTVVSGIEFLEMCRGWGGNIFCYFFNKKFLHENNLFLDEKLRVDILEFLPRLCLKAKKVMHIDKTLYIYRIHENNESQEYYTSKELFTSRTLSLCIIFDYFNMHLRENEKLLPIFKKCIITYFDDFIKNINMVKGFDSTLLWITEINYFLNKYICMFNDSDYLLEEILFWRNIKKETVSKITDTSYKIDDKIVDFFQNIENEYRERVKKILSLIPFECKDKVIGVYGIGTHTKEMIKFYEDNIHKICSKIIFIDSIKGNYNEEYNNKKIINVNDVNEHNFDCIVISSATYEKEMFNNLKQVLIKNIPIHTFYDKDEISIF